MQSQQTKSMPVKTQQESSKVTIDQDLVDWVHETALSLSRSQSHLTVEDAKQIAQDSLENLLQTNENIGSLKGWCWIALRRAIIRRNQNSRHQEENKSKIDLSPVPSNSPEDDLLWKEYLQAIENEFEELTPKLQEALRLRIYGLSYQEIADILEISLKAVKSRIHDARKKLKEILSKKSNFANMAFIMKDREFYNALLTDLILEKPKESYTSNPALFSRAAHGLLSGSKANLKRHLKNISERDQQSPMLLGAKALGQELARKLCLKGLSAFTDEDLLQTFINRDIFAEVMNGILSPESVFPRKETPKTRIKLPKVDLEELCYLLFLRVKSSNSDEQGIPETYRWSKLISLQGFELYDHYRRSLVELGAYNSQASKETRDFYQSACSRLQEPSQLESLIKWVNDVSLKQDELYEAMSRHFRRARMAYGHRSQQAVTKTIVNVMKPRGGEVISNPLIGPDQMLLEASQFISKTTEAPIEATVASPLLNDGALLGTSIDPAFCCITRMLFMLRNSGAQITRTDVLASSETDVLFCSMENGMRCQINMTSTANLTYPTENQHLASLQCLWRSLKPGGRSAIIIPMVSRQSEETIPIMKEMLRHCNLHTILRLPVRGAYANIDVFFFERGQPTKNIWLFDLYGLFGTEEKTDTSEKQSHRSRKLRAIERQELYAAGLQVFEEQYGEHPNGQSRQIPEVGGRWRHISLDQLEAHNYDFNFGKGS